MKKELFFKIASAMMLVFVLTFSLITVATFAYEPNTKTQNRLTLRKMAVNSESQLAAMPIYFDGKSDLYKALNYWGDVANRYELGATGTTLNLGGHVFEIPLMNINTGEIYQSFCADSGSITFATDHGCSGYTVEKVFTKGQLLAAFEYVDEKYGSVDSWNGKSGVTEENIPGSTRLISQVLIWNLLCGIDLEAMIVNLPEVFQDAIRKAANISIDYTGGITGLAYFICADGGKAHNRTCQPQLVPLYVDDYEPKDAYDIAIEKYAIEKVYKVGDQVIYTIKIKNLSTTSITNVVVTDVIPAELEFVTCKGEDVESYNYNPATHLLTVLLGNMGLNEIKSFDIVTTAISAKADLKNVAIVNSDETKEDKDEEIIDIDGNNNNDDTTTGTSDSSNRRRTTPQIEQGATTDTTEIQQTKPTAPAQDVPTIEFVDQPNPRAGLSPEEPKGEEEIIPVVEVQVKPSTGTSKMPKTGETETNIFWIIGLCSAVLAILLYSIRKRIKERNV